VSKAILPVAFVLCVLFIVSCGGDDGGTGPKLEGQGFICEYGWTYCWGSQYMGVNGCRKDGGGQEDVDRWVVNGDWWSDMSDSVDSVWIEIPVRYSTWLEERDPPRPIVYTCLKDTVIYLYQMGAKDGNHWLASGVVGETEYSDEYENYYAIELFTAPELMEPDYLARAVVYWKNGTESTYTDNPRQYVPDVECD